MLCSVRSWNVILVENSRLRSVLYLSMTRACREASTVVQCWRSLDKLLLGFCSRDRGLEFGRLSDWWWSRALYGADTGTCERVFGNQIRYRIFVLGMRRWVVCSMSGSEDTSRTVAASSYIPILAPEVIAYSTPYHNTRSKQM